MLLNRAFRLYEDRRRRTTAFGGVDLLEEHGWDILLYLAMAAGNGETPTISATCEAACTNPTLALRWIQLLESQGLIAFSIAASPRRVFLSADGERLMLRYLETV